jgi:hypothetical protein
VLERGSGRTGCMLRPAPGVLQVPKSVQLEPDR